MQKDFKDIVEEEVLNEMPYISLGNQDYYDFELEKYKENFNDFLAKLKSIVMGIKQPATDSNHNTSIHLKTSEEVDKFLDTIKNDKMLMLYVWNHFIKSLRAYKLKGTRKQAD